MTATTQTGFDFNAYRRAIEASNPEALAAFYADDAECTMIDAQNPPGAPLVRRGKAEIAETLEGQYPEGLAHRIEEQVLGDQRVAYLQRCHYPEGQEVVCHVLLDLRGEKIARARCVQAYDE